MLDASGSFILAMEFPKLRTKAFSRTSEIQYSVNKRVRDIMTYFTSEVVVDV